MESGREDRQFPRKQTVGKHRGFIENNERFLRLSFAQMIQRVGGGKGHVSRIPLLRRGRFLQRYEQPGQQIHPAGAVFHVHRIRRGKACRLIGRGQSCKLSAPRKTQARQRKNGRRSFGVAAGRQDRLVRHRLLPDLLRCLQEAALYFTTLRSV